MSSYASFWINSRESLGEAAGDGTAADLCGLPPPLPFAGHVVAMSPSTSAGGVGGCGRWIRTDTSCAPHGSDDRQPLSTNGWLAVA
jgi:hypothetical protein